MYEAPETKASKPEAASKPESLVPEMPDLGDSIEVTEHDPRAFEIDPTTGWPKFYHSFNTAIAQLPVPQATGARRPAYANKKMIAAGAFGGTVALLGLGGYAISRAMQKRKAPKVEGQPDLPTKVPVVAIETPPAAVVEIPAPRQFAFDWNKRK